MVPCMFGACRVLRLRVHLACAFSHARFCERVDVRCALLGGPGLQGSNMKPIHWACMCLSVDILRVLLKAGASVASRQQALHGILREYQ